ncbi:MAG: hypothetical protein CL833_01125, partial [Crocinitomicaceae bacterium]|nr:hypothetical protein [Crocinitomicaceae bacterium]
QDSQHKKGITLTQHENPITGVADLVTVTFDLRALQLQLSAQQGQIGVPVNVQQQMQQQNIPPQQQQTQPPPAEPAQQPQGQQ